MAGLFTQKNICHTGQQGFTLLEIIVSLVVMSLIGLIAGMGIVQFTKGFVMAKENAITAGKAQLAMLRLEKEFTVIESIANAQAATITYSRLNDAGNSENHTVTFANSNLLLDNDLLTDQVDSFSLAYLDEPDGTLANPATGANIIEVILVLSGAEGVNSSFTLRVTPRNI